MNKINALVLAVNIKNNSELESISPNGNKFLLDINGQPLITRVIANLRKVDYIKKVILISDAQVAEIADYDLWVESGGLDVNAIIEGIKASDEDSKCLIIGGDMPLANSTSINNLFQSMPNADAVYPVASKTDIQQQAPLWHPYFVKAREGEFTGSSMVIVERDLAIAKSDLLKTLFEARNNPGNLLKLVGPQFAVKFMFSTISITDLETALKKSFECDVSVLISSDPKMLISVDSIETLDIIKAHF